jgi:Domain of unknown function (DUF4407)
MDALANLLRSCSGADREILDRKECRTERDKYAGIGASILLTGLLGSCSGGYALFFVFQSWLPATVFGLLWGGTIFNLDRSIVQSIRKGNEDGKQWQIATPRIILAIFIALTVAKPLELKMFEPEIDSQIQKHNLAEKIKAQQQTETAYPEIKQMEAELSRDQTELEKRRNLRDQAAQAAIEEAEGTSGTKKEGKGPVYEEKRELANQRVEEFNKIEFSMGASFQGKREKLDALKQDRSNTLQVLSDKQKLSNGLLARVGALHEAGQLLLSF